MDAPHGEAGDRGPSPVSIERLEGDIYVVTGNPEPLIPSGQSRDCPQCGRPAWLMSRFCWHCSFDFGNPRWSTTHKVMFLAGVCNLAAAIALALSSYASHAG